VRKIVAGRRAPKLKEEAGRKRKEKEKKGKQINISYTEIELKNIF
jgi:hypothetical protein